MPQCAVWGVCTLFTVQYAICNVWCEMCIVCILSAHYSIIDVQYAMLLSAQCAGVGSVTLLLAVGQLGGRTQLNAELARPQLHPDPPI